jgi:hypothetical protein
MSPGSVQRLSDNDMHKNKGLKRFSSGGAGASSGY